MVDSSLFLFFHGGGRGLKKERGETAKKLAAKANLTMQAWRQRRLWCMWCIYICAVGNGLEPWRSICQMITCSHLQSVLEADQRPEPMLRVIQAISLGLNSIFFTSHTIRLFCCSTVAQQWHPGAISSAVEISLLTARSVCTWAKTPPKLLGKNPNNVNKLLIHLFHSMFFKRKKKKKELLCPITLVATFLAE